eukprot:3625840-Rhodomonas_salina.5
MFANACTMQLRYLPALSAYARGHVCASSRAMSGTHKIKMIKTTAEECSKSRPDGGESYTTTLISSSVLRSKASAGSLIPGDKADASLGTYDAIETCHVWY